MYIKISASNFDKICRTCLTERGKMQSLFECSGSVASMLMSLTSLQIKENDGFPSNICLQCLRQVNRSVSFKQQCEQSNAKLQEFSNKQTFYDQIRTDIQLDLAANDVLANISNQKSNDLQELEFEDPQSSSLENNFSVMFNIAEHGSDYSNNFFTKSAKRSCKNQHSSSPCSCITGQLSIGDDETLWKHVKKNSESTSAHKCHNCFVCQDECCESSKLTVHMNNHNVKVVSNICDTCGNKFSSLHSLKRHHKLVHSADRPYVCQVCGKGFLFQGGLNIHLRKHRDERPFACPAIDCGKKFIRPQVLKVHMRLHSGEKNYSCRYCDKRFTQSTSLKVHEKIHTGDRSHLCSLCAKRFIQASQLKVHMQRHHSLEKPQMRVKCIVCDKQFRGSYELKVHMRKHTGDRPFGCDICQQKFAARKGLQRHMLVHSDTRNHACTICNKAFKTEKTLKVHMRIHTGERPYSCDICGQNFSQSATRNSHLNTHNASVGVKQGVDANYIVDNVNSSGVQTIQIDKSNTF